MDFSHISIRGARVHNLRNISLDIPRNKLVVITGISGSGKSSLAFDTIYAEGQRRFMETLSPYARQFIGNIERPDVDFIEGLSPVISIDQKSTSRSPRSTVGTVTEIHDFVRLLYAKAGRRYDPVTGQMLQKQSEESIREAILALPEGTKLQILSPLVTGRKGHYRELFDRYIKRGYLRARIDGEYVEMTAGMQLERYKSHNIELVVDRLVVGPGAAERIGQAVNLAISMSEHKSSVICDTEEGERYFSTQYAYSDGTVPVDVLAPNQFSFNSPYGACPECNGLGDIMQLSAELMVPDMTRSLEEGAIEPFGKPGKRNLWQVIRAIAKKYGFSLTTPMAGIPVEALDILLYGSGSKTFDVGYSYAGKEHLYPQTFQGAVPYVEEVRVNAATPKLREWAESFMIRQTCPVCGGSRLKQESLHVKVDGLNIAEAEALPLPEALEFFRALPPKLTAKEKLVAAPVLHEITKRIEFLLNVGLGYLTLDRSSQTLSGGEAQRIRLASQLGSQLSGVLYVLDEPSIGLHQRDNHKLIDSLHRLRDLGNTVLVVEHDKDTMLQADEIIDLGPGAGEHGGLVVAQGTATTLGPDSVTAGYLNGTLTVSFPPAKEPLDGKETERRYLKVKGCRGNNLKNVDAAFPLGSLISVTGVSGSGKSTLINETLYPILARHFYRSKILALPCDGVEGIELIDKVVNVDQSPIGRTPRSNPATYTGAFTFIRDFFTRLPEAQIRGYKAGRFSFNVKGGRCEVCQGAGTMKIEMNFLPDVYVQCEHCKGERYNRETLQVKYKGKSIADVLEMPIEEAAGFFEDFPRIRRILDTMQSVGLGYLKLGQPSPLLSGGEAQRIKLSAELAKIQTGKTLYILDEPTTGLHFQDIQHLLEVLRKLVDKGNTVIVIEHNLDIVRNSDWIIDLGPEGGSGGGMIVAEGTPEEIARRADTHTGHFLKLDAGALLNGTD